MHPEFGDTDGSRLPNVGVGIFKRVPEGVAKSFEYFGVGDVGHCSDCEATNEGISIVTILHREAVRNRRGRGRVMRSSYSEEVVDGMFDLVRLTPPIADEVQVNHYMGFASALRDNTRYDSHTLFDLKNLYRHASDDIRKERRHYTIDAKSGRVLVNPQELGSEQTRTVVSHCDIRHNLLQYSFPFHVFLVFC